MTAKREMPAIDRAAFIDVIYGPQIENERRLETHRHRKEGVLHLHRRTPMAPAPGEPIAVTATTSGPLPYEEVHCEYRLGSLPWQSICLAPEDVSWDDLTWSYVRTWRGDLPPLEDGQRIVYRIRARASGSKEWIYADSQSIEEPAATLFSALADPSPAPAWARDALIYHIFLDRFDPGSESSWTGATRLDEFHGGTLEGVIERLEYIASLGFNTLWLSPVFASPSHHGYDATDLLIVEPRFGTNETLDRLIRAVHDRGMRLLLDFVPNHWSDRHPTFLHAVANPDSPFRDWYLWKAWPGDYECFYDVRSMPKLNLASGSPARAHLLEVARYWLQRGVNGYRLDHAEGPAHDFWTEFRQVCREANPDAWLFGEIGRPPNFLRGYLGALHGCLDFALARALRATFALEQWSLGRFEAFLRLHEDYLPASFSSPAFLDNHDMNRFLYIAGEEEYRLRLAALVLYALPGAPVVYYGTERGLSQERSMDQGIGLDEARLPVDWEDDSSRPLRAYFSRLGELRKSHVLRCGPGRLVLHLDEQGGTYAFRRGDAEQGSVVVVLNLSDESRFVRLPAPGVASPVDLLNGQEAWLEGEETIVKLAPRSGAFIASADRMS